MAQSAFDRPEPRGVGRSGLAWLLATSPDPSVRNGEEAVQLAESAKGSTPENAEALDTLGAAYAEDGQFARAAATARHALELAQAQGNQKLAAQLPCAAGSI